VFNPPPTLVMPNSDILGFTMCITDLDELNFAILVGIKNIYGSNNADPMVTLEVVKSETKISIPLFLSRWFNLNS